MKVGQVSEKNTTNTNMEEKKGRGIMVLIIHRLEAQCNSRGVTVNADILLELLSVWNLMKTGFPLRCAGV